MKKFNEVEFQDLMMILNDHSISIETRYSVFSYFVHRFESKEKVREIFSFIESISSSDIDKKDIVNDVDDFKIAFLESYLSVVNISDNLDSVIKEFYELFHSFPEIFLQHQDFSEELLEKYISGSDWLFVLETQYVSEDLFMKHEKDVCSVYKSYGEYFNTVKPNHSCLKMMKG